MHDVLIRALPLALAALLSGCAVTPDFFKPDSPIARFWPGADKNQDGVADTASVAGVAGATGATSPAEWPWRAAYTHPQLQALIATALANNHDLSVSVQRIAEARAQYGITESGRFPTLNAGLSNSTSRVPGGVFGSGSASNAFITRRNDLNVSMASSELDFWNRIGSLGEAAKATYLATEAAHDAFRLSLIADVTRGWLSEAEAAQRAELARATVDSREHSLDLVRKRRSAGLASELDVATAEAALAVAQGDSAALAQQRALAHNALVALVGVDSLPPVEVRFDADSAAPVAAVAPGVDSSILLERPDVRAAEESLRAAQASVAAARAAFYPKITLTAAFGVASRQLSGLFDPGTQAWSFAPAISLPIFDAGRNEANLDIAKARQVAAVADYEKTVQQAFRDVADALAAQTGLAEQIRAREAQLDASRRRAKLAEARQREGVSTYLDVLDAQRDLYAAEQGLVAVRVAEYSARVSLYAALGGGALTDPADADHPATHRSVDDDRRPR